MAATEATAEPWESRIGVPESFVVGRERPDVNTLPGGALYEVLTDALRTFLDDYAGSRIDDDLACELASDLFLWRAKLRNRQVSERLQAFGHRPDMDGRGQVMAPAFEMRRRGRDSVEGTVTFGRYFLGGNGAVHGGAVALLFDEILGRLSDTSGRPPARTAYLHTNFLAITPVNQRLEARAWFVSEEGRKRVLRAELRQGDTVCAEAEGLFISLLDGQR